MMCNEINRYWQRQEMYKQKVIVDLGTGFRAQQVKCNTKFMTENCIGTPYIFFCYMRLFRHLALLYQM